ncbi:MAG: hypothetical protein SNJ67_14035 [Chloracidobacterium sp.]|uniref:Uncharacterized protein n=1 Tax=Chloracidobacterium validum TaxID=2821543 RepID=A0ABX8B6J9_9BACT|nr:hypothetical protein [Chloracidobacterium validum]QUW02592.1 hypothetical protein J8C06_09600 [Chloracidobacterium validum]
MPPDLARYSPREALVFVETDSLPNALRRLETLSFWKAIKPAIGVPGQFDDVLTSARVLAWLDVGPAEAKLLARARWGLIITGLTAEVAAPESPSSDPLNTTSTPAKAETPPGAALDVTPQLTVCLATGLSAEQTLRVGQERLPLIARKLFGCAPLPPEQADQTVQLMRFRHPERPETSLWAAARGDLLFLANDEAAIRACLEATDGRRATLADLPAFKRARQSIHPDQALLFAFVNPAGLEAALRLRQGNLGHNNVVSQDGKEQSLLASMLAGLSDGLGYSLDVQEGQVVDRYYLALHPSIVTELRPHVRPALGASAPQRFLPKQGSLISFGWSRPLTALDRVQTALAARSNAAVAFLSRELLDGLRERYGIRPREPLDDALGDQWLAIHPGDEAETETIWGISVRERARLLPTLDRYLRADGASITNVNVAGSDVPLAASTHRDGRAACFLDNWLLLGNRPTLERFLAQPPQPPVAFPPVADAFLYRHTCPQEDLSQATLALIKLTRAGEATPLRLTEPAIRQAIEQQPVATGYFRLGDDGCLGEMRSPIGNLAYLTSFISNL